MDVYNIQNLLTESLRPVHFIGMLFTQTNTHSREKNALGSQDSEDKTFTGLK